MIADVVEVIFWTTSDTLKVAGIRFIRNRTQLRIIKQ